MSNPIPGNKPFKKGQSGNPKGRPRKIPKLEVVIDQVLGEEKNNTTAIEAVIKAMLARAVKGDVQAAKLLLEYSYGKAKSTVELTNPDGSGIFTGFNFLPGGDKKK